MGNNVDAMVRHAQEWAGAALRQPNTGAAGTSTVTVGGGMHTILLRIGGEPVFRLWQPNSDVVHETDDLARALETLRRWAVKALGR